MSKPLPHLVVQFDTDQLVTSLTGDAPVYPCHPLVVATCIMHAFDSFAEASARTPHGWPEALGDSRVPGAGDHCYAGVDTLRKGAAGASVDEMVAYAVDYWERGRAGGHVANVEAGRAQALAIEVHFRTHVEAWLRLAPPESEAAATR